MSLFDVLSVLVAFVGVIFIPVVVMIYKGLTKFTAVDVKLDSLVNSLRDLVIYKDKVHAEMSAQMTEDRRVTNDRLQYLERTIWNHR